MPADISTRPASNVDQSSPVWGNMTSAAVPPARRVTPLFPPGAEYLNRTSYAPAAAIGTRKAMASSCLTNPVAYPPSEWPGRVVARVVAPVSRPSAAVRRRGTGAAAITREPNPYAAMLAHPIGASRVVARAARRRRLRQRQLVGLTRAFDLPNLAGRRVETVRAVPERRVVVTRHGPDVQLIAALGPALARRPQQARADPADQPDATSAHRQRPPSHDRLRRSR